MATGSKQTTPGASLHGLESLKHMGASAVPTIYNAHQAGVIEEDKRAISDRIKEERADE